MFLYMSSVLDPWIVDPKVGKQKELHMPHIKEILS